MSIAPVSVMSMDVLSLIWMGQSLSDPFKWMVIDLNGLLHFKHSDSPSLELL